MGTFTKKMSNLNQFTVLIWLRKCFFLTDKLGIKFIPDPDWPDPDPK